MAATATRLTFVVTKEMKILLSTVKKNQFLDCTQSDMIRELVSAGLDALDKKAEKEKQREKAP